MKANLLLSIFLYYLNLVVKINIFNMSLFRVCTSSWKFNLYEWEIKSMAQRLRET